MWKISSRSTVQTRWGWITGQREKLVKSLLVTQLYLIVICQIRYKNTNSGTGHYLRKTWQPSHSWSSSGSLLPHGEQEISVLHQLWECHLQRLHHWKNLQCPQVSWPNNHIRVGKVFLLITQLSSSFLLIQIIWLPEEPKLKQLRNWIFPSYLKPGYFRLNTIPIVLGGVNYTAELPPNSYINAAQFITPQGIFKLSL